MNRWKYRVGDLRVVLIADGRTDDGRNRYRGVVYTSTGRRWRFNELGSAVTSRGHDDTADDAARAAVSFGSYYTTHNRAGADRAGETKGYPCAEVADDIESDSLGAMDPEGRSDYRVTREG